MSKITHKVKLKGTLHLKSGLHIGASKESVQIGGVDSPVIRRADNNQPYIPGSSLKGKIRCLLEQRKGVDLGGDENINSLFGYAKKKIVSKLIVRDAYLTKGSAIKLKDNENVDMPFTEVKFENTINRFDGTADNPRQIERVPAGAKFDVEFIVNVWSEGESSGEDLLGMLKEGIHLLNNDYLGGNGTRGYGHVELVIDKEEEIK